MYFLDTNTCIYFLNGSSEKIKSKILTTAPNDIKIPAIVKAELLLGAYKSKKRNSNLEKVEAFLVPFEIIPLQDQMSYVYADIRYKTETAGKSVGLNDLFIAAVVKFYEGILITNNIKEFSYIKGLKTNDWYGS